MTDLLVRQKQLVVGPQLTHDSLITHAQGSGRSPPWTAASSAKTARMDAATGGCCWPGRPGLGWTAACSAEASPCSWVQFCYCCSPVELAAEQDLSPGDAFEALLQPALLQQRSVGRLRRAGPMWTMPAMPCGARNRSTSAAGGPSGTYGGTRNPAKRETRWLQHRPAARALQRVPRGLTMPVSGICSTTRAAVIGRQTGTGDRNRSRERL